MDRKKLLILGGTMIAAILLITAIVVGIVIGLGQMPNRPGDPQTPQEPENQVDPATIVRSPQITGEYSYYNIKRELTKKSGLIKTLTANGYPLAYDSKEDVYYLSIADEAVGQLTGISFGAEINDDSRECYLAFEQDMFDCYSYFKPINNREYKVRVYTDMEYEETSLVITTMPFMTINTEKSSISKTDVNCVMALQDGNWKTNGTSEYTTSCATIRVRGASSAGLEKKPYRLNLKQEDYTTQNKTSLLGLRSDDDWVLDAMYNDPTRMHNRISSELWNEMAKGHYPETDTPATECRYVEVILNGKYIGLYNLIEPVDRKQLSLDEENGVLIKAVSWEGTYFDKYADMPSTQMAWMGFEMKLPDTDITFDDWELFYDLLEATADYKKDKEHFVYMASKHFSAENLTDYWVFLNAFYLRDNRGKNLYWSTVDRTLDDAVYYITPWDCDLAFGYRYGGKGPIPSYRAPYDENHIKNFVLLERFIEEDIDGARAMVCEKWDTLTGEGGLLSVDNVCARFDAYFKYLSESGAWDRETERWPISMNEYPDEEFEYLREWLTGRYEEYMPEVVDAWREKK